MASLNIRTTLKNVFLQIFNYCQQISKLLLTMSKIQFESDLKDSELEILRDFYMQIALQPLQFTTAGYYTINLQFLAGIFTGIASYEGREKKEILGTIHK